ncbi:hypothetical protein CKO31_05635 [Thiohalocapsa halophila]|uniref:Uncharacterized protein n=1 Tax=Thiohalocapsa halophila TaxID=69359 RepID=A0ABS1CFE3_9GAMM|nr:hypothetical protein [Thiohalocapsa halophila]MBK1630234.1 hypothetical protein [Thiohalocapsa halophila]
MPDTQADATDLVERQEYKPDALVEDGIARFLGWYRGIRAFDVAGLRAGWSPQMNAERRNQARK